MRTLLIFPPVWESSTPYSSLAVLSAYLKQHNIYVDICDLNIELQYHMLTDIQYIKKYIKYIERQKNEVTDNNHMESIELSLQLYQYLKDTIEDNVVKKVQLAKNQKEEMKFKIMCNYLRLILSTPYYPTIFSDLSYKTKLEINKIENIFEEVECEERNIFRNVFKNRFLNRFIQYDIIGISIASTNQLVPSLTLAKMVKSLAPNVKIIIGGALLPYLERYIRIHDRFFEYADFFVVGEGELALRNCIRYINGETSINNIPNTIYKQGDKVKSNIMNHTEDVNELPVPDYSQYPMDKYITRKIALPYLSSRGCYWNKCSFCSLTCNYGNKYRQRDFKKVEDDIIYLKKRYNFDRLVFNDEALTVNQIDHVADILLKNNLNISWNCLARLNNNYTNELLKKAKESGLLMLSLGLESGSQKTLDSMQKGTKIDEIPSVIKKIKEHNIWVNLYFIIGFPTETEKDFQVGIDFLKENFQNISSLSYTIFRLEANSDVFRHPEKYSISTIYEKNSKNFFGPDYRYETNIYNSQDLIKRYNRLYNLIDKERCNPNNIYFDFDSIFSFLCEGKEDELNHIISVNVNLKNKISILSENQFKDIEFSLNKDIAVVKGNKMYMVLNLQLFELYSFNHTAIYMIRLIERGISSFDGIINQMEKKYQIDDNDTIKRDIIAIISKMMYLEILQYRGGN